MPMSDINQSPHLLLLTGALRFSINCCFRCLKRNESDGLTFVDWWRESDELDSGAMPTPPSPVLTKVERYCQHLVKKRTIYDVLDQTPLVGLFCHFTCKLLYSIAQDNKLKDLTQQVQQCPAAAEETTRKAIVNCCIIQHGTEHLMYCCRERQVGRVLLRIVQRAAVAARIGGSARNEGRCGDKRRLPLSE